MVDEQVAIDEQVAVNDIYLNVIYLALSAHSLPRVHSC